MTRDEALKKMQAVKSYMTSGNPIWSVTEIGEAFDMAIEALEQPERKTGEWIWKTEDKYECSCCHEIITVKEVMNIPQYITCPMCDAKMEGEEHG